MNDRDHASDELSGERPSAAALQLYLDGEGPEFLRREVEKWIERCDETRAEFERLQAISLGLRDLPELQAPVTLRRNIMARISEDALKSDSPAPRPSQSFPSPVSRYSGALAASVLLLITITAWWGFEYMSEQRRRVARLEREPDLKADSERAGARSDHLKTPTGAQLPESVDGLESEFSASGKNPSRPGDPISPLTRAVEDESSLTMSGKELAGTPLGRVKVGALSKIPDDGVPTHTYRVTVGEDDTATRERLHALLESIANDQTPPTKDGGARDEELNQLSFLPFKVDRDHESAYLEMKIEVEAHRHARASLERLDELARSGLVRANKSRSAKISDSVSLAEQSRSVSGKASEGSKKKERVAPVVGSRTGSQGDRGTRAPATGESAESEKDGSRAKAGSAGERRDDPAAAVDRSRVRVVIILVRPAHDRSVERTPPPGPRPRRAP